MTRWLAIPLLVAGFALFGACEKKGDVGDAIDRAADKAREATDNAVDKTRDAAEEAGDRMEEATDH